MALPIRVSRLSPLGITHTTVPQDQVQTCLRALSEQTKIMESLAQLQDLCAAGDNVLHVLAGDGHKLALNLARAYLLNEALVRDALHLLLTLGISSPAAALELQQRPLLVYLADFLYTHWEKEPIVLELALLFVVVTRGGPDIAEQLVGLGVRSVLSRCLELRFEAATHDAVKRALKSMPLEGNREEPPSAGRAEMQAIDVSVHDLNDMSQLLQAMAQNEAAQVPDQGFTMAGLGVLCNASTRPSAIWTMLSSDAMAGMLLEMVWRLGGHQYPFGVAIFLLLNLGQDAMVKQTLARSGVLQLLYQLVTNPEWTVQPLIFEKTLEFMGQMMEGVPYCQYMFGSLGGGAHVMAVLRAPSAPEQADLAAKWVALLCATVRGNRDLQMAMGDQDAVAVVARLMAEATGHLPLQQQCVALFVELAQPPHNVDRFLVAPVVQAMRAVLRCHGCEEQHITGPMMQCIADLAAHAPQHWGPVLDDLRDMKLDDEESETASPTSSAAPTPVAAQAQGAPSATQAYGEQPPPPPLGPGYGPPLSNVDIEPWLRQLMPQPMGPHVGLALAQPWAGAMPPPWPQPRAVPWAPPMAVLPQPHVMPQTRGGAPYDGVHRAATSIQAAFRGYRERAMIRRNMHSQVSAERVLSAQRRVQASESDPGPLPLPAPADRRHLATPLASTTEIEAVYNRHVPGHNSFLDRDRRLFHMAMADFLSTALNINVDLSQIVISDCFETEEMRTAINWSFLAVDRAQQKDAYEALSNSHIDLSAYGLCQSAAPDADAPPLDSPYMPEGDPAAVAEAAAAAEEERLRAGRSIFAQESPDPPSAVPGPTPAPAGPPPRRDLPLAVVAKLEQQEAEQRHLLKVWSDVEWGQLREDHDIQRKALLLAHRALRKSLLSTSALDVAMLNMNLPGLSAAPAAALRPPPAPQPGPAQPPQPAESPPPAPYPKPGIDPLYSVMVPALDTRDRQAYVAARTGQLMQRRQSAATRIQALYRGHSVRAWGRPPDAGPPGAPEALPPLPAALPDMGLPVPAPFLHPPAPYGPEPEPAAALNFLPGAPLLGDGAVAALHEGLADLQTRKWEDIQRDTLWSERHFLLKQAKEEVQFLKQQEEQLAVEVFEDELMHLNFQKELGHRRVQRALARQAVSEQQNQDALAIASRRARLQRHRLGPAQAAGPYDVPAPKRLAPLRSHSAVPEGPDHGSWASSPPPGPWGLPPADALARSYPPAHSVGPLGPIAAPGAPSPIAAGLPDRLRHGHVPPLQYWGA